MLREHVQNEKWVNFSHDERIRFNREQSKRRLAFEFTTNVLAATIRLVLAKLKNSPFDTLHVLAYVIPDLKWILPGEPWSYIGGGVVFNVFLDQRINGR